MKSLTKVGIANINPDGVSYLIIEEESQQEDLKLKENYLINFLML